MHKSKLDYYNCIAINLFSLINPKSSLTIRPLDLSL